MGLLGHGQVKRWDASLKEYVPGDVAPLALSADVVNSTNVLAGLADLARNVESGAIYRFEATLWVSDSGEGIQIDLAGGSAAMTWFRATFLGFDNTLSLVLQSSALATVLESDFFSGLIEIKGAFQPSADGTFIPRAAQKNHASGSITTLKGSSILMQEAAA